MCEAIEANTMKKKIIKNLADMINDLDDVEISMSDLKKLGLQIMLDTTEDKTKIEALKALIEIEKVRAKTDSTSELLSLLKED